MKFARIEMLFFVWAVPVLLLVFGYGMRRRRRILARFASRRGLQAIAPDAGTGRRWIKAMLVLGGLLFAAVALSGPQYGYKWQEIEQKGIDIVIALDCSRSMLATDIRPTRLDRAKREIFDLLHLLQGDRVGLVAFAGTAFLQCPLTLDYEAFHLFLNALSPDFLPVGGSDIAGALQTALSGFNDEANAAKAVILITDGESTGGDPVKAAEAAARAAVKIFCIGVGRDEGVPVPAETGGFRKDSSGKIVLTRLDEDTLKKVAALTQGAYVRSVAGDMDLDMIYTQEIRGRLEQTTVASGRKKVWEDRYQWFLALAILALLMELFLPSKQKTTVILILCLVWFSPAEAGASGVRQNMEKGLQAYAKGDYEQALKLFIDAQLEDPERPEIFYNIGNAYYKMGDFDAAYKHYEQALDSENEAFRQKVLYNLGNANYRRGQLDEAISRYEASLEIDPQDETVRENLEFVKKVKTEPQKTGGQDKPEDGEDKKKGQSEAPQNSPGEPEAEKSGAQQSDREGAAENDEASEPPARADYGKEIDPGANQEPAGPGQADPGEDPGERRAPGQAACAPDLKKQAERMLNRLQDRPGAAMIPLYRERHVEKDW